MNLRIEPDRVTRLHLTFVLVLTLVDILIILAFYTFGWRPEDYGRSLVDFLFPTHEHSLSGWYENTLIVICGVLLLLIGIEHWKLGRRAHGGHLILLAAIFFGLSFGKTLLDFRLWFGSARAALGAAWMIPGAALLGLLTVALLLIFNSLPRKICLQFILAGTVFVVGALGVELIGEIYAAQGNRDTALYHILILLEEGLEMSGIVLFLRAILMYFGSSSATLRFSLSGE